MLQREKHFKSKEKVLGQFFTPVEVADFIVSLASLHLGRRAGCDPACGDGVFLSSMIKHGFEEVVGIDADEQVVNQIPSYIKERATIMVGDALVRTPKLDVNPLLKENYFDLVVGNPPFSAKYGRIRDQSILDSYELGRGLKSQAIEILFLERFIRLAGDGGVIGIILPDGIFLNIGYRKVREFILNNCRVLAVISLPRAIFKSSKSTTSKTSILFAIKGQRHHGKTFLAEVRDTRELHEILELYRTHRIGKSAVWSEVNADSLHPKTYLGENLPKFRFPTAKLGELLEEMFCGGTEYGEKREFADSGLRYISAKVVTPLGIDFIRDEKRFIKPDSPMDKKWAHIKVGDVLFVRVGVGCIGRAAVAVDESDLGVADDWIYVLRVKRELISPYYLVIFLQTKYGRAQIDKAKRGVGTVTIPQRLLRELLIPLPPKSFQQRLERKYVEMVKNRRRGNYSEARKLLNEMINETEKFLV